MCSACAVYKKSKAEDWVEVEPELARWKRNYPYECSDSSLIDSVNVELITDHIEYESTYTNYKVEYFGRRELSEHLNKTKPISNEIAYGDSVRLILFDNVSKLITNIIFTQDDLKLDTTYKDKYFLYDLKIIFFNYVRNEAIVSLSASYNFFYGETSQIVYMFISKDTKKIISKSSIYSSNIFSQSHDKRILSINAAIYNTHSGLVLKVDSLPPFIKQNRFWPIKAHPVSDSLILISSSNHVSDINDDEKSELYPKAGSLYLYRIGRGLIDSTTYFGVYYGIGNPDNGVLINKTLFYLNPSSISNLLNVKVINDKLIKGTTNIGPFVNSKNDNIIDRQLVYEFTISKAQYHHDLSDTAKTLYPTLIFGIKDDSLNFCKCFYRKQWISPPIKKSIDRLH